MKPASTKPRTSSKRRRVRSTVASQSDAATPDPVVLTIGHSNRPLDEFLEMLGAHNVECVVDVRTIPRSRHNPQFNSDALENSLREAGIGYVHKKVLGGLRHAAKNSINMGWRNASFRGFADYMQTPEFDAAVAELIEFARGKRCAIMCAEAVPWRCHRSLISDALIVRRIGVEHIMNRTRRDAHALTSFAHVDGTRITYPSPDGPGLPFPDEPKN
jgi:uncharacterized protein (DUF488 family)